MPSLAQRGLDGFEQPPDDGLDGDALGLGAVIEKDAVAQGGIGQAADVLGADMDPAFEDGAGLGAEHQELAGPVPAPQLAHSLMKSGAPGWRGREAAANRTA